MLVLFFKCKKQPSWRQLSGSTRYRNLKDCQPDFNLHPEVFGRVLSASKKHLKMQMSKKKKLKTCKCLKTSRWLHCRRGLQTTGELDVFKLEVGDAALRAPGRAEISWYRDWEWLWGKQAPVHQPGKHGERWAPSYTCPCATPLPTEVFLQSHRPSWQLHVYKELNAWSIIMITLLSSFILFFFFNEWVIFTEWSLILGCILLIDLFSCLSVKIA